MAIDTALKRFSIMLDYGSMPPPDGSLTAPDRLFMLEFYSGIAATAPVSMVPGLQFTMPNDNLEFTVEHAPEFTTEDW